MQAKRAALAAALVAIVVQLPSLGGGFVHDDKPQIAFNPLVNGLGNLPVLWRSGVWAGAGSGSSYYRPLMMTSFAADASLVGRAPFPMHGVQLLLFAALVAAATRLVAQREGDAAVGLAAGLVLAVHPVNVEAVAWISARCDLLVALFAVLCLMARSTLLTQASSPGRRFALHGAESVAFFLALASKESGVAVLPALLALDRIGDARFDPQSIVRRWGGIIAALAIYAALRTRALGSLSGGLLGASDPLRAVGALGQGALRLVLPLGLSMTPPDPGTLDQALGALVVVAGGAALLALWLHRGAALLPLTLGLAFLAVAATGAARIGELADRYLLLPSLGAGWLVARALRRLALERARLAWAAGAAPLLLFAFVSLRHAPVYASDETLWTHAYAHNPRSLRAALNVATALIDRGDIPAAQIWLERASALDPEDNLVRLNRAVVAAELGNVESARQILLGLAQSDPGYWPAQLRLGHLALDAGDPDEASSRYEAALRIHPLSAEAWAGLGVSRSKQGRGDAARKALTRALDLDPEVQNAAALRAMLAGQAEGSSR